MTPPHTLVLPAAGDWSVRVVPNLYPALERQEVVIHSRRHTRSLAELEDGEVELVAAAWQERRAKEPAGYLHALVNEGREAGSSLPHSHSQLAWLPGPPQPEPALEGELVLEHAGVVARCPRLARLPYETAIAPLQPERGAFDSELLASALKLLAELIRRLQALEGSVPLNAWLHDAAGEWRLVLLPRLSILAGLELGAGIFVNALPPEEAAERLRNARGRPEAASNRSPDGVG